MTRKKVNLQWIANESTRRVTLKKRIKALTKKASELTTLCGVRAFVVVYREGEAQPVASEFKGMPNLRNLKKMTNQEEFLRGRVSKLHDQVSKSDHENHDRETSYLLHETMAGRLAAGLAGVTIEELMSLDSMVERKMMNAKKLLQNHDVGLGPLPEPFVLPKEPQPEPELEPQPQPQEMQGWLGDLDQHGGELAAVVSNALDGIDDGFASPCDGWCDMNNMMQPSNDQGGSALSWPWDPFPPME